MQIPTTTPIVSDYCNRANNYNNNNNYSNLVRVNNNNNNNLQKLNTSNYCQVLNSIKQVLKMLTTKNYNLSKSPSQEKINLNYEAVGQLSDQKSHRFFRFGLRLHLSVENLNTPACCEGQNQNQIQNGDHQHQPALSYSPNSPPSSKSSSAASSAPSSWTDSYLYKAGLGSGPIPPSHYYTRSPPQSIASSPTSTSSTISGSGVNALRELTLDTASLEQHFKSRVAQLGTHLSKLGLGIPEKVTGLIENGRDYARTHPVTFVTLIALLLSCSVPVLAFLIFAIGTVAVTFVGFLFVEGTILTVASVVLTSTLLLVGFTTLTLISLVLLGYVMLNASVKLVTGSSFSQTNPINAFMQFLSPSSSRPSRPCSLKFSVVDDDDDVDVDDIDDLGIDMDNDTGIGHDIHSDELELTATDEDEEDENNEDTQNISRTKIEIDHDQEQDTDVDAQIEDLLD